MGPVENTAHRKARRRLVPHVMPEPAAVLVLPQRGDGESPAIRDEVAAIRGLPAATRLECAVRERPPAGGARHDTGVELTQVGVVEIEA